MTTQRTTVLTGVKPTGQPHLGNYFGAIQPALSLAQTYGDIYLFIADYHALNAVQDAQKIAEQTKVIAASWLAAGLDTNKVVFYRQSDIPEIFELQTILSAYTPKGWMNKAHAYKAAVDNNTAHKQPADSEVNMGLYTYPILMASDIIIMDANIVPVGKDQVQHVEIARDIAQRFNAQYNDEVCVLPSYKLEDDVSVLPGTDGRKMSKSYDNVIPLFANTDTWWKAINKTQTSTNMDEQSIEQAPLYQIYKVIASDDDAVRLKSELIAGEKQWKEAKEALLAAVETRFNKQSKIYADLMTNPEKIQSILQAGAEKARERAVLRLNAVKKTIGVL